MSLEEVTLSIGQYTTTFGYCYSSLANYPEREA